MNMSDRIVVMNIGRVEQIGSAERIYNDPRTRFVADFVGQINLLDTEITGHDIDVAADTQVVVEARPQDAPNEIGANLHIGWQAEDSSVLTQ